MLVGEFNFLIKFLVVSFHRTILRLVNLQQQQYARTPLNGSFQRCTWDLVNNGDFFAKIMND